MQLNYKHNEFKSLYERLFVDRKIVPLLYLVQKLTTRVKLSIPYTSYKKKYE